MAKKITGPRIATANRLDDGQVVFLKSDGSWVRELHSARIARSNDEASVLESAAAAAVRSNIVVDPYLIEVEARNGSGLTPVEHRERMRTSGPSVGHSLSAGAEPLSASAA